MPRWWMLVALAVGVTACALLWVRIERSEDLPVWRAEFFNNMNLEPPGTAFADYTTIDFAWGDGAPLRPLSTDAFSARLDTCLNLRAPLRIAFHLASDDGARLFVNGRPLIDNWGVHAWGTKSGNTLLAAGRHHLRVDYFEGGGDAALYLGANPPILDASHLESPAQSGTSSNPCTPIR